jgi:hypothetical protein
LPVGSAGRQSGPQINRLKERPVSTNTTSSDTTGHGTGGGDDARRWVLADAVVSGAGGVTFAAGASVLDGPLGAPTGLLLGLAAFFLAYTAALVLLMRLGTPSIPVGVVAVGNMGWAVLSVVVVATDALTLTAAGAVLGIAQGLVVGGLGVLQLRALRDR